MVSVDVPTEEEGINALDARARQVHSELVAAATTPGTRVRRVFQFSPVTYGISFLAMILIWQAYIVVFDVPAFTLPSPLDVARGIWEFRDLLVDHTWVTLKEVLAGWGLAVAVGVPLAVMIASSRLLEGLFYPFLVASQAIPKIAIAPILVTWTGFGFRTNVVVALSIAIFPMVINTVLGLKSIDPDMIRLGRSMGASRLRLFLKVRAPNALPNVFVGLKLAVTFATIGAIVGEFIAGSAGLGYLIQSAMGGLRTVQGFAAITVLSVMSIGLYLAVEAAERFVIRWHASQEIAGGF